MRATKLTLKIAVQIIEYAKARNLCVGEHLPAQTLASAFRVSRSPVNTALELLDQHGIVRREENRGFFLAKDPEGLAGEITRMVGSEAGEEVYFQIANERLSGELPGKISEKELMRRFKLSRGETLKILHRIAQEGWIERLPGKGWAFAAMLDSAEAYKMAYQFRASIEPAAILQPTFEVDSAAFKIAREQQQSLLDGDYLKLSRAQLFEINSGFHEMIVSCSRNVYFTDAIKRVNASRRLAEYSKTVNRSRLVGQSLEHIHILDLLDAGQLEKAAEFLKVHIEIALQIKKDDV